MDKICSLHYFADTHCTCVVLAGGDIIAVREEDGLGASTEAHVEMVGSVDAGITAARWSPDEELLVITTGAASAVLMSRSFDPVAEAALSPDHLNLDKHVSVGWGKKETQFQGKGAKAKALRDPTLPEKMDEGVLSAQDDGRTSISWRGDGAYVAINSVEPGQRRVIRIYTREGLLDSVSEPVDGLEGALSWRPAGNLLAAIQRLEDRVNVVFFERNGLRHGQFTLRLPGASSPMALHDISLDWNPDSTVLAVLLQDRVQLWTMGNYHWYLKQEIPSRCCAHTFNWHPEKALHLVAASPAGILLDEFVFATARGPVTPPHDFGSVAVIDGQTVKLTPFRTANVPPPMALFDLDHESAVVDVAFSGDNSHMAVLLGRGVVLYSIESKGGRLQAPKLVEVARFAELPGPSHGKTALQIAFSGPKIVQVLHFTDSLVLQSYDFAATTPTSRAWCCRDAWRVKMLVPSLGMASPRGLITQNDGGVLASEAEARSEEPMPNKFPTLLPWAEVVHVGELLLAFGLSRSGHLYVNSRQLAKNCTSFIVTPDHLVFTTTNHLLKFVHLTAAEGKDMLPGETGAPGAGLSLTDCD